MTDPFNPFNPSTRPDPSNRSDDERDTAAFKSLLNEELGTTSDKVSKFPNQQFVVFATPVISLYLKGSAYLLPDSDPSRLLANALSVCLVKRTGSTTKYSDLSKEAADLLATSEAREALYTANGKAMHLHLLKSAVNAGLGYVPAMASNKEAAVGRVLEFIAARDKYLQATGLTLDEYLAKKAKPDQDKVYELDLGTLQNLDW